MSEEQKHFSASELAGLPGMPTTERRVLEKAKRELWPSKARAARGGGREYSIACLPAETQLALAEKALSAASAVNSSSSTAGATFSSTRGTATGRDITSALPLSGSTPDPRSESLGRIFESKSEKQKAKARAALEVVTQYHELTARGFKATAAVSAVVTARAISPAKLYGHLARVRGEPRDLWLFLLLPGHAGRTARAEISAEAWEVLKGDYLAKPAKTAKACIERLKDANARGRMGWIVPSDRTLLRRLQAIPRDVKVLARKGREELLKLFPPQQRVKLALASLDIVNGDGYKHKGIWVAFDDGRIARACTWFWADVYSGKILSWRTDETEHTDLVRLSFGDLVATYSIPRAVLQDNTRAAANKTMSGGVRHRYRFKVKDEEPDGVFKLLGVERVMWATPGHGQAKPVERAFGIGGISEYVDKAPEFSGRQDENERYNGRTKPVPLAELQLVIAREVAAMNARIGRRGAIHNGRSWDEVFNESYARIVVRKATEEQRRLWLLCTEPTKVHRNATIVLDAGRMVGEHRANRYWSRELGDHIGRLVAARFDPAKLHEGVHVYTADGRYIAFAECLDPAGFNDQNAARDQARDRSRFMRSTREALQAERRMTAREAGATLGTARAGRSDSTIPAPKAVQGVFRDPLERPRYVPKERSAEERADLAQLERELVADAAAPAVNVHALRSDSDKHAHWKTLDARRAAGERLSDQDEQWWAHWQTQDYYRIAVEAEREFEQGLARQKRA
jgi:hypothetical protein